MGMITNNNISDPSGFNQQQQNLMDLLQQLSEKVFSTKISKNKKFEFSPESSTIIDNNNNIDIESYLSKFQNIYTNDFRPNYYEVIKFIAIQQSDADTLLTNIKQLQDACANDKNSILLIKLAELYDYIKFEEVRKTTIKNFSNKIQQLHANYKNLNKQIHDLEQKQTELSKNTKDIPILLVTILGIFAAVLVSAFSGTDIVSDLCGTLCTKLSPYQIVLIITFVITGIGIIILLLLNAVAVICDKKFIDLKQISAYFTFFITITITFLASLYFLHWIGL